MKKRFLFALAFVGSQASYAQFTPYSAATYGATTPAIIGVGIGDFATPVIPTSARLHINNFYCASPTGGLNGLLFRTDGNTSVNNTWTLFTGANAAGATEKFRIQVPANTPNAIVQTTLAGFLFLGTQNINRTKLNPSLAYSVNTYPAAARDGYFLLGGNGTVAGGNLYDNNHGAYSLLHLNGSGGGTVQELGYRPWMQTGITFTDHLDRAYIGYRNITGEQNDLVLNWSNDPAAPTGPDNLVFNFTTADSHGGSGDGPDLGGADDDGREIMRLTGLGQVGIGPRFNNAFQPQSTLHQHQDNATSSWFQISNQYLAGGGTTNAGPTAVTAADGVRMGIYGNADGNQNGTAMLYNQENRALLFSANANTAAVTGFSTNERVRVMAYNTPTVLPTGAAYGFFDPISGSPFTNNRTRISISHNPSQPLTRPVSLFHIGYNSSAFVFPLSGVLTTDGWRPWMEIGTYTSSTTDNMYVGLKREASSNYDAVVGWGRNQDSLPNAGPEHLRFIFAGNYSSAVVSSTNQAKNVDGLETGRFYAGRDTLGKYGRFGVGDFTANGLNQDPTHKLDVDGNGRFRLLPDNIYKADASVNKVVMVDSLGVLRWNDAVQNEGVFGYACGDTTDTTGLINDRFLPMNNFNIYFEGQGIPTTNAIGLGYNCGQPMPAKFNSYQRNGSDVNINTIAGHFHNNDREVSSGGTRSYIGVAGVSDRVQNNVQAKNIGGNFDASGSYNNSGVVGNGGVCAAAGLGQSSGGEFHSDQSGNATNFGIRCTASNSTVNYAVYGSAATAGTPGPGTPSGPNYAGYFNGDVYISGTYGPSDINLKEDVDSLTNSLNIIKQLNPKTYHFKHEEYPSMNLPAGLQYGLIAQEVETVLPDFVSDNVHPAVLDSTGAIVVPEVHFKGLGYQQFVPLLIGAVKEQQNQIDSLTTTTNNYDSIIQAQGNQITDLNDRLSQLEACISALHLCDGGSSMAPADNGNNEKTANVSSVELKDAQSIVLDQNVPNPFAEQTVITYELPQTVQKAQMLFYNAEGKLINTVDLNERGKGLLNVFANDLSNGIYTYTLVVDGQIKGNKRMVKNK